MRLALDQKIREVQPVSPKVPTLWIAILALGSREKDHRHGPRRPLLPAQPTLRALRPQLDTPQPRPAPANVPKLRLGVLEPKTAYFPR